MCSTFRSFSDDHLRILLVALAARNLKGANDSFDFSLQVMSMMGVYMSSSLMWYSLSPSIELMMSIEPSEKPLAIMVQSGLY